MNQLLLDTCILIDYLRGNQQAINYINGLTKRPLLSALTIGELYAGVREGQERQQLDAVAKTWAIAPLTTAIAQQGGLYRRQYFKSHGVGIIDALIAATAEHYQANLVTSNTKHFPMLQHVTKPY